MKWHSKSSGFQAAVLLTAMTLGKGDSAMQSSNPASNLLRDRVIARDGAGAREAARRIGSAAGDTLLELAGHPQTSVRQLVLELAAEYPSAGSSRAILSRLDDGSATIRSVAGSMIGACTQKEIVEDLFQALEKDRSPSVAAALVLQIGIAGDNTQLARLGSYAARQKDPEMVHACVLAMARLGDPAKRARLIAQLRDPDASARIRALRDTSYLADPHLAAYFLPALEDQRDADVISGPHENPRRYSRVCDVAVQAMAMLGWKLSFSGRILERHSEQHLAEAIAMVRAIPQ